MLATDIASKIMNEKYGDEWVTEGFLGEIKTLPEYQDEFDKLYDEYDALINASEEPSPHKATLYREDYADYQWYYILYELGLIDTYLTAAHLNRKIPELLIESDKRVFNKTNEISITLA